MARRGLQRLDILEEISLTFSPEIWNGFTLECICLYHVISWSLSPRHGASSGCGWRNGLQCGRELRIYWIISRGQPKRGSPPAWGLDEVLTTPHSVHKEIIGPGLKRDEVTGEWRKLHNEELNDLYSSPNIVRVKSRKNGMCGACSAYRGGGEAYRGFWWGNLSERYHLGDPDVDGSSGSGIWGYGLDRAG